MAKVVLDNLTMEQARLFAQWFEGQGEQDAYYYFEEHDIPCPNVDVQDPKWYSETKDTVTIRCK